MRSLQARLGDWLYGDDASTGTIGDAQEPFESHKPLRDLRRTVQQTSAPAMEAHDCPRILVAEADPYHRRVLRVLLANPRISAIEVEDGQSAIDLLSLRSFDLILLGMNLPIMTGPDVVRWVRRSNTPWCDIPIIGMIDDGSRDHLGKLLSWGMTDWTPKPIARADLSSKLVGLMPNLSDAGL